MPANSLSCWSLKEGITTDLHCRNDIAAIIGDMKMKVVKVGKCYCCGKFGRLHEVIDRELCEECMKDHRKAVNIINTILRPGRKAK